MDFVTFESFANDESLPLPQPSILLPLKPQLDNLKLMSNLSNIKSLLKLKDDYVQGEDGSTDTQLADRYASLSLKALEKSNQSEGSTTPAGSAEPRKSALSKRLARALNPSLSDSEIKELFGLLDWKNTDISLMADPGVMGSVARKNVRGEIEADLIKSHTAALTDYGKVVSQLELLGKRVTQLDLMVTEINENLERDEKNTAHISQDIHELAQKQAGYKIKKELLLNFKKTFTLNEYEQHLLTSGDINCAFFEALAKAEEINEKCLILLALDDPLLGKSVMEKSSDLIERAVNKILTFCNRSLVNLYLMNDKSRTETLHQCMDYLKKNPVRYAAVIDTYVDSRTAVVLEDFAAQTNSTKSGSTNVSRDSRPVYYTSHDSVRFVADLLAYVHSVVVNEIEVVDGLFQDDSSEFQTTKADMISRILIALGRPVKATIEQLLSQTTKLQTLHKLYTNLELYHMMYKKLEYAGSLVETLVLLLESSRFRIVTIISNNLATIASSNQAQMDLSTDLQPPEWTINFYSELLPLIDTMTTETILSLPEAAHKEFLELIVDRPISIFETHLSKVSSTWSKKEIIIFKQNYLDLVLSKIMPLAYFQDKVLELNRRNAALTKDLSKFHLDRLLQDCKLYDFYNIVNMICPIDDEISDAAMYEAITENKLFNHETIASANEIMQEVLPTALLDVQNSLMKLNLPVIVTEVISDVMVSFTQFYSLLSDIVQAFLHKQLLSWTDDNVATLLGVENLYSKRNADN